MTALSRKEVTRIGRAVQTLFSKKGILPADQWRSLQPKQLLSRQLQLAGNRQLLMSDAGYGALQDIVRTIYEANLFDDEAEFSDVWSACRDVIQDLWSQEKMPDDGHEMVALVRAKVAPLIDDFTFVVPLQGVELKVPIFPLGAVMVVPSTEAWLSTNARGATDGKLASGIARSMEAPCWLVSGAKGTYRTAERKFEQLARLAVGLISILAAGSYEGGAEGFRIRAVLAPEDGTSSGSTMAVWSKTRQDLSFARRMAAGQPYALDDRLLSEISRADSVIPRAIEIVLRQPRTDLEEAIVKAVFWYADAHRDSFEVMRFIKFWSCIEAFFPAPDQITQNVALGATAVLVYGPLRSVPPSEYQATKKRLVALYGDRSRAVHHGKHDHVTSQDVADLSQWAAWLVLNAVALSKGGMTERSALLAECQRLNSIEGRTAEDATPSAP